MTSDFALKLILGALPWLMGWALGHHLIKVLGDKLKADGAKRGGALGAVEKAAGAALDDADDFMTANAQALKDLSDPSKRAAALATLSTAAKAAAPQAAADAVKEAVQNG